MAKSGKLEQSPDHRRAADYEPSKEGALLVSHATSLRRSMFNSSDEDDPLSPVPSPKASPALFSVRSDDDGVSHRN